MSVIDGTREAKRSQTKYTRKRVTLAGALQTAYKRRPGSIPIQEDSWIAVFLWFPYKNTVSVGVTRIRASLFFHELQCAADETVLVQCGRVVLVNK